jgi:hypothetical protein
MIAEISISKLNNTNSDPDATARRRRPVSGAKAALRGGAIWNVVTARSTVRQAATVS